LYRKLSDQNRFNRADTGAGQNSDDNRHAGLMEDARLRGTAVTLAAVGRSAGVTIAMT
jgi:hypothetical protein